MNLNIMDRSTLPPPTYHSVRKDFASNAHEIAREVKIIKCPHDIAQADRAREVYLMGERFCNSEMGTPQQINALVTRRL